MALIYRPSSSGGARIAAISLLWCLLIEAQQPPPPSTTNPGAPAPSPLAPPGRPRPFGPAQTSFASGAQELWRGATLSTCAAAARISSLAAVPGMALHASIFCEQQICPFFAVVGADNASPTACKSVIPDQRRRCLDF